MNKPEAYNILARHLNRFLNYSELVPRVEAGQNEQFEVRGESNILYHVEVIFDWEVGRNGPIRVFGSIYDTSAGGFFPLTQSLLLTPKEATPPNRNGEASRNQSKLTTDGHRWTQINTDGEGTAA